MWTLAAPSAMMPYIMSPMKRATGLWEWGEILPKKIEESDFLAVFFPQRVENLRMVDAQVVHNQKHLARRILHNDGCWRSNRQTP